MRAFCIVAYSHVSHPIFQINHHCAGIDEFLNVGILKNKFVLQFLKIQPLSNLFYFRLLVLTIDDLKDLGIQSLGYRLEILVSFYPIT
jgi:hypothetical protein